MLHQVSYSLFKSSLYLSNITLSVEIISHYKILLINNNSSNYIKSIPFLKSNIIPKILYNPLFITIIPIIIILIFVSLSILDENFLRNK